MSMEGIKMQFIHMPCPAAVHFLSAGVWPLRIPDYTVRKVTIISVTVPVTHPFGDIPNHIERSNPAHPIWQGIDNLLASNARSFGVAWCEVCKFASWR